MGQVEAEHLVLAMLERSPGGDKPNARTKVRSAYRSQRHPIGCEHWANLGYICPQSCPLKGGAKQPSVKVKRPGSGMNGNGNHEIELSPSDPEDASPNNVDLKLAQRWARQCEGRLLYCEGDQWYAYDQGIWQQRSGERVQADLQGWLTTTRNAVSATRVRNVLFLAKSLLGPISMTEFNRQPAWIPLSNGVFDTMTGDLLDHSPERMLTYRASYGYDPEATCPTWERLLQEWMIDGTGAVYQEWIDLLQEWFGYCLISETSAQTAMLWVGEGGNGKGVATRVIETLVGQRQVCAVPIELLHDPYHRAALQGKLVGLVNEPDPKAMARNGAFFKALTGEDLMSARRPTEKVFEFRPTIRLVISTNELPSTRDLTRGYFRRMMLVEWRYQVPDHLRDNSLDRKLLLEIPGIFNWAMVGLHRLRARGWDFIMPEESRRLLADYRESEDPIGLFLSEKCEMGPGLYTTGSELYRAYDAYCKTCNQRPETANMFGRQMTRRGCKSVRPYQDGKRMRSWHGVRLLSGAGSIDPDPDLGFDGD
jgi:putative DNA primase/helicase